MLDNMVIDGSEFDEAVVEPVDEIGDLLVRIGAEDQKAFAALYDAIAPRVFGLIRRVVVDASQSEEVLQEVFLEIWRGASRFDPSRGKGRTWVLTMAHRRAVDRVRAAQATTDRDMRVGLRDREVPFDRVAEDADLRWESARVNAALGDLSEPQREAITLAYYGGYSQTEIAVLTGAPLGTVKTRMRDGLTRLRTRMGVRA